MPTIDKFLDAVTSHFARSQKVACTVIRTGLLLFGAAWSAAKVLLPAGSMQDYALIGLSIAMVAVTLLGNLLGAWCNRHRSGIDSLLLCPQCEEPLQMHRDAVIATGDCPHCGCRVLADRQLPILDDEIDQDLPTNLSFPIDKWERQPDKRWLRLICLKLAIVYAAVTIMLIILAFELTGRQITQTFVILVMFIPLVLCWLCTLVLVPGPHRDWIYMLFLNVFLGLCAIGVARHILNQICIGDWINGGALAVFLTCIYVGFSSPHFPRRYALIPFPCPECGRQTLLWSAFQPPNTRTFYKFYWCLNCQGRYKRRPGGAWKRARSPKDDGSYWLT